ncbi:SDR family oxidoreductase, partial [Rhizobium ruizarguesonis]
RLDAAHNNAGIEQPAQPIGDISEDLWDRVIAVNLKSVFLCMKYQIEIMPASGGNDRTGFKVMAASIWLS